jgi:hypothetical protein
MILDWNPCLHVNWYDNKPNEIDVPAYVSESQQNSAHPRQPEWFL